MATERPTPTGPVSPDLSIIETRVYRGPNIWSYEPAVHLVVDLGSLEDYPTTPSTASPTSSSPSSPDCQPIPAPAAFPADL